MRFGWLVDAGVFGWLAIGLLLVGFIGLDWWFKRASVQPLLATLSFGVILAITFSLLLLDPALAFRQRVGLPVFFLAWVVLVGGTAWHIARNDPYRVYHLTDRSTTATLKKYREVSLQRRSWSLLPFAGPLRMWSTPLTPEACLRRVTDDIDPTARYWAGSGWRSLAHNPSIVRKVNGWRFQLLKVPVKDVRTGPWYFFGEIKVRHGTAVISGQYRTPWYTNVGWFLYLGFGLGIALFFTVIGFRDNLLIPATAVPKHTWLIWLFIPMGLATLPISLWRNRTEQINEAVIAAFIEEFFEAHEQQMMNTPVHATHLPPP